jgi:hypothetical protein
MRTRRGSSRLEVKSRAVARDFFRPSGPIPTFTIRASGESARKMNGQWKI